MVLVAVAACSSSHTSTTSPAATSAPSASTAVSSAGAGAAPASSTGDCKKVRFALHAGLGAGALHRYIWKPYQAGTFTAGAHGRKTALVKAAVAGAFTVHEFKVALADIRGCPSAQALTARVQSGLGALTTMTSGLKSGNVNPTSLTDADKQVAALESAAKSGGITIKEQDPTAGQLATGNTGE